MSFARVFVARLEPLMEIPTLVLEFRFSSKHPDYWAFTLTHAPRERGYQHIYWRRRFTRSEFIFVKGHSSFTHGHCSSVKMKIWKMKMKVEDEGWTELKAILRTVSSFFSRFVTFSQTFPVVVGTPCRNVGSACWTLNNVITHYTIDCMLDAKRCYFS